MAKIFGKRKTNTSRFLFLRKNLKLTANVIFITLLSAVCSVLASDGNIIYRITIFCLFLGPVFYRLCKLSRIVMNKEDINYISANIIAYLK